MTAYFCSVVRNFSGPHDRLHNMNTLLERIMSVAGILASVSACGKDEGAGDAPDRDEIPVERPVELVTDSYTAYPSGANACADSYLTLKFASEPQLGSSGRIRIIGGDGTVADMIDMADVSAGRQQMTDRTPFNTAMDAVGSSYTGYYRIVWYDPVYVDGNTVTIRLHSDKLEYEGTYSVEIDEGVIVADGFGGIEAGEWTFSVMPRPEDDSRVTVGSRDCDFMTVQGAVNFACSCGQSREVTVAVSEGVYREPLYIRSKNNLTIEGEGRDRTIIMFDNCNDYSDGVGSGVKTVPDLGEPVGSAGGRSVVLVENCDMLHFRNISVENTHGHGSQAETIYFNSNDGRMTAVGCNFTGEQDTLELKGWCLFRSCTVTGDVDFIWGYAKAALFESCEIRSCENANGGYVVQARCASGDRGFVFLNCELTAESGVEDGSVWLARSGGSASYYDNVTYVNCRMGDHIADAGWYGSPSPNPPSAAGGNGWKEYGSLDISGAAADLSARYPGSSVISSTEYESLYRDAAAVFSDCPHGISWAE